MTKQEVIQKVLDILADDLADASTAERQTMLQTTIDLINQLFP